MRRKYRFSGRFYFFLLLFFTLIVFLIVRLVLKLNVREAIVSTADTEYSQRMDCIIIRDETVVNVDSTVRIEYVAGEDTYVESGDTIAYVYTSGYSEGLLSKLEETRAKIQSYHRTAILNNIKDDVLNRYDAIVDMMVAEFKQLANQKVRGSIQTATEQLEASMVNRQEYLRQNKREDTKLAKLYDEEKPRLLSIQAWQREETAPQNGVITFYMDGYESDLTINSISAITPSTIRQVLAGNPLSARKTSSLMEDIYKLVDQNNWYIAVTANAKNFTPVIGQEYFLEFEGYEDLAYTAEVTTIQKEGNTILAVFKINQPIGPLIYQRTGHVKVSITIKGLSIPKKALTIQGNQYGVWLYDTPNGTFVPVEVLSEEGRNILIQPLVDGTLSQGSHILIK